MTNCSPVQTAAIPAYIKGGGGWARILDADLEFSKGRGLFRTVHTSAIYLSQSDVPQPR